MDNQAYTKQDWQVASDNAIFNKPTLLKSKIASCYCCLETFPVTEITEYVDMDDDTALCPMCGIDAVLGDATNLPICDIEYLKAINRFAFCRADNHNDMKMQHST